MICLWRVTWNYDYSPFNPDYLTPGSLLKKNVKIMSENDALRQRIENLEDGLR